MGNFKAFYSKIEPIILRNEVVVCQAGHFLLLYDSVNDKIVPSVNKYMQCAGFDKAICDQIGFSPTTTFEVAVKVFDNIDNKKKQILTLVNDWQYLKTFAQRRYEFYNSNKYLEEFEFFLKGRDSIEILKPAELCKTGSYFSELYLRKKFKREVKKVSKKVNLETFKCDLVETGFYCGRPNCTAEVAQLVNYISQINKDNTIVFINLYPISCKQYVYKGTQLGIELFNLDNIEVINIGLDNFRVKTLEDVFNKADISDILKLKY